MKNVKTFSPDIETINPDGALWAFAEYLQSQVIHLTAELAKFKPVTVKRHTRRKPQARKIQQSVIRLGVIA
jgi:hypothetical protein